ncbi:MAG: hypothetical protein HY897_24505 [Deltaproteobacteria bacterium]|nr:hypothetical protein [Deltaproteobacteria bacterium]
MPAEEQTPREQRGRRTDALVVQCSSFEYRPYFESFVLHKLGIHEYDLLAVPGGIQVLTMANYVPKFASLPRQWLEFMLKKHGLMRIIVFGHEDCAWYKDFRWGPIHVDLRRRQQSDLVAVASDLREQYHVQVNAFYGRPDEAGKVDFEMVV